MTFSSMSRMMPMAGIAAACLSALTLAPGDAAAAERGRATNVPTMTIKIYNSSALYSIYPVLSTGRNDAADPFMQAVFGLKQSELAANPYPKQHQFRIYINPKNGIPPGGDVTLMLPFYSQLVPTKDIDPKQPDQYIDWWGGGRIEIFDGPKDGPAPAAIKALFPTKPGQEVVKPVSNAAVPTCDKCEPLVFYKDPAGLKTNEPSQLLEYTLGAVKMKKDPVQIDLKNVDFDVSYVDAAYLPVTMEPFNNKHVGYVGSPMQIAAFKNALADFTQNGFPGWPQFVDNQGKTILKVASPLHILAGDPDMTKGPWAPITALSTNWKACIGNMLERRGLKKPKGLRGVEPQGGVDGCDDMRAVRTLFWANYQNYTKNYDQYITDGKCTKGTEPIDFHEDLMISHVYGWGPFNENCKSNVNLLEDTPGYADDNGANYQKVKDRFDDLQYMKSGAFDPYVLLIHGEKYLNAPNAYAFSVDDAVGNIQAYGEGLIISVGGLKGMPNPNPATPPINISVGYGPKDEVRFTKYGVCTATPDTDVDPDYVSFAISVTDIGDCPISLIDNKGKYYTFEVVKQPPYLRIDHRTDASHAAIDCSANKDKTIRDGWCNGIFARAVPDTKRDANYIITPAPDQPPKFHRTN